MSCDFPHRNTYEYLNATGVLDKGSEREIDNARKEFRRLYLEHYQKKYNSQHARITLCFTNEEKKKLQEIVRSQGKKTATFLKQIISKQLSGDHWSVSKADEKCRQIEILVSLCMDVVEEMIFQYPQFEKNLQELLNNLNKIEQILKL